MQKKIAIGALWMFGGNGLQQVLQFGIFILLARFLEPEAFGYVALASVVFDIAGTAGRCGIPETLLQRRRLSPLLISHAFIFVMALGLALTLLILTGTVAYVYFHAWDLLAKLLFLLVPVTLMQAAEMVPEAILRQQLEFKWIALRNNIAAVLGGVCAIAMALLNMGVYALVAQRFISLAILLGMVWAISGHNIRIYPFQRYRRRLFVALGMVGSHLVSGPLAGMLGPRLNDAVVGIVFSPAALGQFKIARRIFDFVAQVAIAPLATVAEAAFPKLMNEREELRKVYKKIQGICSLGVFPLFAGLAISASMWVPLVLGERWMAAVPLIQLTSLAGVPAVVNYFQTPLLIAYRENGLVAKQNIVRVILGVVLTGIGSLIGLEAVVILFVVQAYGFMIFNWIMIKKIAGWTVWENINSLIPALVSTLGLCVVMTVCRINFIPKTNWLNFIIICLLGFVAYLLLLFSGWRKESMRLLHEALGVVSKKTL